MLEKLLLLLGTGKGTLVALTLGTSVVVTGTIGGQVVDLVITPVAQLERADPLLTIESPALGAPVSGRDAPAAGIVRIGGWAFDRDGAASDGSGIDSVKIFLDGREGFLGEAILGDPTPDLTTRYGERAARAGWHFDWDVRAVSEDDHTLLVVATSKVTGRVAIARRDLNDPLLSVEAPREGGEVELGETLDLRGWAIDRYLPAGASAVGAGVSEVSLYLEVVDEAHRLAVTEPALASPEVAERFGERFANAAWKLAWTADGLPGTRTLHVVARSAVSGRSARTTLQIEVVSPKRSGPSCGELIGTEKGKRIALLQASWYERHALVMSYNDREVERSKRETYKALIGTTKVDLQTIRDAALAALHAQAARVDEACRAGLPTAELVAHYDVIVAEAVRSMDSVRDTTLPILGGMSGRP